MALASQHREQQNILFCSILRCRDFMHDHGPQVHHSPGSQDLLTLMGSSEFWV